MDGPFVNGIDDLNEALRALEETSSLMDIKAIRDNAEAIRTYAQAARKGIEYRNRAAELRLRAERKAGRILSTLNLRGGDRRSKNWRVRTRLADLGISRAESKRWQQLASIAESTFCDYLETMKSQSRAVTAIGLIRAAMAATRVEPSRFGRGSICADECASADADGLMELANHGQLLMELLRPACVDSNRRLAFAELRVVCQILSEMRDLAQHLTKHFGKRCASRAPWFVAMEDDGL
jgi:hypothetical protein